MSNFNKSKFLLAAMVAVATINFKPHKAEAFAPNYCAGTGPGVALCVVVAGFFTWAAWDVSTSEPVMPPKMWNDMSTYDVLNLVKSINDDGKYKAEPGSRLSFLADIRHNQKGHFRDIMSRYARGQVKGRLSLESLYEFTKKPFNRLDQFADMVAEESSTDNLVEDVYGPHFKDDGSVNWERYAALAHDALVANEYSWYFKKTGQLK